MSPIYGRSQRRETSRVSFLMCPFCVRTLLTDATTLLELGEGSAIE